jgi:hypothetical protein
MITERPISHYGNYNATLLVVDDNAVGFIDSFTCWEIKLPPLQHLVYISRQLYVIFYALSPLLMFLRSTPVIMIQMKSGLTHLLPV